jgi:hypothetical protein
LFDEEFFFEDTSSGRGFLSTGIGLTRGNSFRFSYGGHFYYTILSPFYWETTLLSVSYKRDSKGKIGNKITYSHLIPWAITGGIGFTVPPSQAAKNIIELLFLPQMITNFKIHYPVIPDMFHVYVGQSTDFFLFYGKESSVYTASKAGFRFFIYRVGASLEIVKPWTRTYDVDERYFFMINIGLYDKL